tara:strand:- start:56 stop:394 length:339 start_codon:yes stop_codon:yes gene_type:complete
MDGDCICVFDARFEFDWWITRWIGEHGPTFDYGSYFHDRDYELWMFQNQHGSSLAQAVDVFLHHSLQCVLMYYHWHHDVDVRGVRARGIRARSARILYSSPVKYLRATLVYR